MVTSNINGVDHGPLEENGEDISKVTKPVSTDVNLDVVSININDDIYSINHHELTAIRSNLSFELKTKPNLNLVHVYLDCSGGNDKRGNLVSEIAASKRCGELVAGQGNGVVSYIRSEINVVN